MVRKFFGRTELLVCGAVLLVVVTLLGAYSSRSEKQAELTACRAKLKLVGQKVHEYFDGRPESAMPWTRGALRGQAGGWSDTFGLAKEKLACPAERDRNNPTYSIHPFAAYGATFSKLDNDKTVILGDTTFHVYDENISVLYGDGHVDNYVLENDSGGFSGVFQIPNPADQEGYDFGNK